MKDFHTPTLVIHGEQDFRVPYTQGLAAVHRAATAESPSKLLVFPGRRPLGSEAAEQRAVVQHVPGLDRRMDKVRPACTLVLSGADQAPVFDILAKGPQVFLCLTSAWVT